MKRIILTVIKKLTDLGEELDLQSDLTPQAFQRLLLRHLELRNASQDVCRFLERYHLDPEDQQTLSNLQDKLAMPLPKQ